MSKVMRPEQPKSGMDSAMGMLQLYNQGKDAYQGIKSGMAKKPSPEDEKRQAMQRRMGQVGG